MWWNKKPKPIEEYPQRIQDIAAYLEVSERTPWDEVFLRMIEKMMALEAEVKALKDEDN